MILRPATTADVADLVRVINLAYLVEAEMFYGSRTTDADIRDRLARPNAALLTVRDDDGLAGSVFVETRGSRGYLGMLAVDPAYQGRGLGRDLVRAAETYARSAECEAMDLDVVDLRSELTLFYGRLGYEPVGDSPYPRPRETKRPVRLIHMTKPLVIPSEARNDNGSINRS